MRKIFIFGVGYSARVIARALQAQRYVVSGTTRDTAKMAELEAGAIAISHFSGNAPMENANAALRGTGYLLVSVQPDTDTGDDAVLRHHGRDLAALTGPGGSLRRIAYLSTTAVYGDQGGAWIDETTAVAPRSARARQRCAAEQSWRDFASETGIELDIYRLSGIYGPGRNPIVGLRSGKARAIVKPGHVFNRIHVEDIAACVAAGFARGLPGAVYNVADDEPAPPQDVMAHAATLCGLPPPPLEDFATADMTPMARSFYSETKRIRNTMIKSRLGVQLRYPTYRQGLAALVKAGP
ncbi:Nucleoside-diphosphate-sugar epimerases [hydrothermal vent metagenome]|uniref:Nucleoside-diphosphate-sugar epimerases n=1 Tax=hydrothermal vent metagenome TaxID=652676 RepID=A0A3B0TT81_9ZZZZ